MKNNPEFAVHPRTTISPDLRTVVARRMLADELVKVPHRFNDAWAEEAEAWLRNADSALAAVAEMLRAGGDTVRGVWYAWDSEQRGYAAGFADRISPKPDRFTNDAAAKALYDTWSEQPGWVPWVERGNSLMQSKARREVML